MARPSAASVEALLIAGLLHDVVEDTDITIEEIEAAFGEDVAGLVDGHTEDKSKSWEERKSTEIRETFIAPLRLKMLVLADKLANMRSIYKDYCVVGNELWERFNAGLAEQAWYYGEMTEALNEMQRYPETAPYYWELVGLYKDVFVLYFYDEKKKKIYQSNVAGKTFCLSKGSPEWLMVEDVIPEKAVVVNRKFAESTEDTWNQIFWKMINADIKDIKVDLMSTTQFSFCISISDKKLCFEASEYGEDCETFFGKDEIESYYKLNENDTFDMMTLLRIKHGKKKSIEDILKEEFAVENGANHFMEYCKKNLLTYELVTI